MTKIRAAASVDVERRFCQKLVSSDFVSRRHAEGLHFVEVLALGDEFREYMLAGTIQEKFWEALA